MKKLLCLLLAAALAFSLTGCGYLGLLGEPFEDEETPTPRPTSHLTPSTDAPGETPDRDGAGNRFEEVWRADYPYDDYEYEDYDPAWFDEYTAPLYEMAVSGGTKDGFSDAAFAIEDELGYVFDMYTLAELAYYRDPSDETLAARVNTALARYYDLYDEYNAAMAAVANSKYSSLMTDWSPERYIDWFRNEGGETPDRTLSDQEDALVQRYYALAAEDEPDAAAMADVFAELVGVRREMADAYGYDSYADYAYAELYGRNFTPADVEVLLDGVKTCFAPLVSAYALDVLDEAEMLTSSAIDCEPDVILEAMGGVLPWMSAELAAAFDYMVGYGLCDIEQDPGKVETGFTTRFYYLNEPFIFNAPYGEVQDYFDMIHEFGHFANAFYTTSDLLYGVSDFDLSELQSQGMEIMFTWYYDDIFSPELADAARSTVLMNMVYSLVDGALYDEFQRRVYAEPNLTGERAAEIYGEVCDDYGCYEGRGEFAYDWVWVTHNFDHPFYYISYCTSALGALELYDLLCEDSDVAMDKYLEICAMDTEYYYYTDALEEAGLHSIFDTDAYVGAADALDRTFAEALGAAA